MIVSLKLLEQLALLVAEAARDLDVDDDAQIAVAVALQARHARGRGAVSTSPGWVPAATSTVVVPSSVGTSKVAPSAASGAGTSRTVIRSSPSRTKRSSSRDVDQHVEVAGRAAGLAGVAAAAEPHALAVGDAGGDVDGDRAIGADAAAAAALARTAGRRRGRRRRRRRRRRCASSARTASA